ncbi:GAF and ANTAR domain-containing protein [Arthrobacter sp. SX1312]|uniref:GAF and ANTAR domain-containing protein n=1 Tax=Arthrobacter sp. SX1312 TaxID=2058896 RepID=UPI000CE2C2A9|nr:GAF and ANTAR domain-containing protein [Arthrobacter sp. SX1312]
MTEHSEGRVQEGTTAGEAAATSENQSKGRGRPSSHHGDNDRERDLATELAELARSLQQEPDSDAILAGFVHAALDLIPGVDEGSVSVVTGRKNVGSRAPSGDLPVRIDALQMETGEGPCLEAAYERRTVRVADMAHEERWPLFAQRAAEAGAKGMLSIQLWVEGDDLGALNLYSYEADAFTDESENVGLLVASHASVAFAEAEKSRQLHAAVDSRDVIGQAKGILMERHKVTGDQAFFVLSMASQRSNIKLRDVADHLISSGELPGKKTAH